MIDEIRKNIQQRLDDLMSEVEKLRHALVELDPRERKPARRAASSKSARTSKAAPSTVGPGRTSPAKPSAARGRSRPARATTTPARTAPGATKAKVLGALTSNGGLTATEVAKAAGLGRATVSTTLSKLAKSGEVVKADRGYRLPS